MSQTEESQKESDLIETRHRPRVLLGATGSVATVKIAQIATELRAFCEVRIILTKSANHFFQQIHEYSPDAWEKLQELDPPIEILHDEDEWKAFSNWGGSVLHIELRRWADVLLIAPLSANSLGKLANGLCDNLLTCVCRAWDFSKPFIVAPAMNTFMWDHPLTSKQLQALEELGVSTIPPIQKELACHDVGKGALAEISTIINRIKDVLK